MRFASGHGPPPGPDWPRKRRSSREGGTTFAFVTDGLLDEAQLHIAPVLLGGGVRLFDAEPARLEVTRVVESPAVTHLTFRVVKD
jgi:hypothetical protein